MGVERITPLAVLAKAAICWAVQPLGQSVRRFFNPAELTIEFGLGEVTPPLKSLLNSVTFVTKPGRNGGAKSKPTDQPLPVSGLMPSKPPPSWRRNPWLVD